MWTTLAVSTFLWAALGGVAKRAIKAAKENPKDEAAAACSCVFGSVFVVSFFAMIGSAVWAIVHLIN